MHSLLLPRTDTTPPRPREACWRRQRAAAAGAPALFALAGAAMLFLAALHAEPSRAEHPQEAAPAQTQLHAEAVEAFRSGQYAVAYGRFAALADAGDPGSAELARVMLRHGPGLFGSAWSATAGQQARWSALVVAATRRDAPIPGGAGRE